MQRKITQWLPEIALAIVVCFFAFRELGTFPTAWIDDSLFMIVAKMVAQGRGYVLPILGYDWANPYILAVGPTLIYPAALSIKLFGFSVAIARLPMALFLLATTITFYVYVKMLAGRNAARWSTALLITLSAFINTGKPVLGEIPGIFFLLLGLLFLHRMQESRKMMIITGIVFGLAVVTKLPYGLIFPALGFAWLVALWRKEYPSVKRLTTIGITALIVFLVSAPWLGALEPNFFQEIQLFVLGGSDMPLLNTLRNPTSLMRLAYGHYALFFVLGMIGLWRLRERVNREEMIILSTLIVLFALYFLNGPGWYRLLLPSTILLFLTAPVGAVSLFGRRVGIVLIAGSIFVQGWWQLDHQGSTRSTEAAEAAQTIEQKYSETELVILSPEVFVLLTENPMWLLQSIEMHESERRPEPIDERMASIACTPIVYKMHQRDQEEFAERLTQISRRYFVIDPPQDCATRGNTL